MLSILKKYSILYTEADLVIQTKTSEHLSNYFSTIYLASNDTEAFKIYKEHLPDVLLLDISSPSMDGLKIAQKVRKENQTTKILVLTTCTDKEILLKATELKLTKYLTKPITPIIFKETMQLLAKELLHDSSRFISLNADCQWDKKQHTLFVKNTPISLLEKEYRLLQIFITNQNKTVTYETIMMALWGNSFDREISINSVRNQVSKLRKKLPSACIDTVYGIGYMLK